VEFLKVVSVKEARDLLERAWALPEKKEYVDLVASCGRQCADDIRSTVDVPATDRSVVDGFALRGEETFEASQTSPVYFKITGEVPVDGVPDKKVFPGQAVKVATGSTLPEGSNAVVMLEHTEYDKKWVCVKKPVPPGQNIIFKGQDVAEGDVVIFRGTVLRPQEVGLLAGIGVEKIPVYPRVRVGIISTGSELVPPGETPSPGKIRDTNTYSLTSLVIKDGGVPNVYGIVPDDRELLREALLAAVRENDIVLVSGGSSVGERDITLEIAAGFGRLLFHGVSMKPGKPTLAVKTDVALIIGLPGQPVSVMVAYYVFVQPLVCRKSYDEWEEITPVRARLSQRIPSTGGREEYIRVKIIPGREYVLAEPILGKSGLISNMHFADGLVRVPAERDGLEEGEVVPVKLL